MAEERMPYKQYAKFDKVFYLYGSTAKLVAGVRPDEWQPLAEEIWHWANMKVEELVTDCMEGFLEPPPVIETPRQEPPNGQVKPENTLQQKDITVKSVTLHKQGTNKRGAWKLYKITDVEDDYYFTFHASFQIGETYEVDWIEELDGGKKWRKITNTPRLLRQPGQEG